MGLRVLRLLLLLLLLALMSAMTRWPWGALWLAVPAAAGVTLLLAWRFGAAAAVVAIVLVMGAGAAMALGELWAGWIAAGSLTGLWMGLREEGGGPGAGERGFMLAPALLLAAALPLTPGWNPVVESARANLREAERLLLTWDREMLAQAERSGEKAERLQRRRDDTARQAQLRTTVFEGWRQAAPYGLPALLFAWFALLASAGRGLAARGAAMLGWPRLSAAPVRDWRLPDAAVWVFLASLAVLMWGGEPLAPTGWTLVLGTGLGFCLQGIAVVESALLARGMPPAMIALMVLFVFLVALPFFVAASVAVGLSDVWLDYRKLEAAPDEDASAGDR